MRYAQIKDGVIKNVIELADVSLEAQLTVGYDYLKRIDNRTPEPHIDDTYDSGEDTFSCVHEI